MHRSSTLAATLVLALALPACFTGRRSADVDRTPSVDTGMGAAILMPGETAPQMPRAGSAPGGTQTTRTGPEGTSSSRTGSAQPSAGNLHMIGGSKIDENRHEVGKEDPLIQKWALAPFAVLAAPFVWAADLARGEPEPGPPVPSANKPGPPPPPPVTDYETERLHDMERELAERAARSAPTPGATRGRGGSIADELAALQRRPQAAPRAQPRATAPVAPDAAADGIVDRDGDGRIDEWLYRESGQLVRKTQDRDGDGQPDATFHYDPASRELVRVEEDSQHDGVTDVWTEYRGGQVVRRRADADGDGQIDTWSFYSNGRMLRHEQDTTGDGFRDRIGFYSGDHLAREEYDVDGDGLADVITYYDEAERITRREEDLDRDGAIDVISHYEGGRLARKEILERGEKVMR